MEMQQRIFLESGAVVALLTAALLVMVFVQLGASTWSLPNAANTQKTSLLQIQSAYQSSVPLNNQAATVK